MTLPCHLPVVALLGSTFLLSLSPGCSSTLGGGNLPADAAPDRLAPPIDSGPRDDRSTPPADLAADRAASDLDPDRDLAFDLASDAQAPPPGVQIGPRPVAATPLSQGTLFAAPGAGATACTSADPCDLWTAIGKAGAGDVLFLRGGVYPVSQHLTLNAQGSASSPIVVESYPGELAVLDGSAHAAGTDVRIKIYGAWYELRRIEVRDMPLQGVYIGGTDNLLEGLHVHGCRLSGIQVYSPYDDFPYGAKGSRNRIESCTVHDNSDAGLSGGEFANGGNADGISISSGEGNQVRSCLVHANSDDGIDTWRSTNSLVSHSISHSNGIADGNGQGFKAGGQPPSAGTVVEHCIAYGNKVNGFDFNSGEAVEFRHNTAYDNGSWGYVTASDTTVERCIGVQPNGKVVTGSPIASDNSWQRPGDVSFVSIDPSSPDFLRPVPGGGFEDIGAYATGP